MERQDKGMAYLLQYENVAWCESGKVRILDRRVYPCRKEYVVCTDYEEVAHQCKDRPRNSLCLAMPMTSCKSATPPTKLWPPARALPPKRRSHEHVLCRDHFDRLMSCPSE